MTQGRFRVLLDGLLVLGLVLALLALAAGTRSAGTRSKAPSEGCQSGPKGNAQ